MFQHKLGVYDDSVCLPSRFVVSVTMGACNDPTLGVRQPNIVPDFPRQANNMSAFDSCIQHLHGQVAVTIYLNQIELIDAVLVAVPYGCD